MNDRQQLDEIDEEELPVEMFPPRGYLRRGTIPIEARNDPICYICSTHVDGYEKGRRVAPGVYSDTEIMESRRAWEKRTWTLYFRMRKSSLFSSIK